MFTTPRKSGTSSTWNTPKKVPLNGLFEDGIWHCNCSSRLPASHFQVKKEGPNKGKWFYTCQEPKGRQCGFFLWDDKAVGREMRAVLNNSRSKPDEPSTPVDPSKDMRPMEGHSAARNKFMQGQVKTEEDEFGDWPLSVADEVDVVERASTPQSSNPETPRKAIKTSQFATPGSKRKWDDTNLPTPMTEGGNRSGFSNARGDVFTTPSSIFKENMLFGLRSPSATPTPSRFRDTTLPASSHGEAPQPSYDITDEVMDLLKDQQIDKETATSLRQLLDRHALKVSGIARGRDITRVALKAKDAKITDLQQKVAALESEREMDKTIIKHLKGDIAQSVADRRGKGRGR
ncbi:Uncharacterized protein BP5553_02935 [Venustampulla echinocandica]|uniref:GRF-type domain-containing protein n=1 Tax=Venustampulla echinocandica TaxID=2656787 RepID=A0A370TST9_9HELO|nr:Uncharacterized protein BP5553_02935 [Venustampulla echinocandica]RDL38595.1 Uncharacterized protein BP5553_02935 [Venustampulla echinocandica]